VTHQDITNEPRILSRHLTLRLSSTRRGAHLARKLAVQQLAEWTGLPHDADVTQAAALVTAELAANAITHGRVPGRDFRLTLRLLPDAVRIEVTDTRPERPLPQPASEPPTPSPDAPAGRGLYLVDAYAARWGCTVHDAYTKTVWAEVSLQPPTTAPPLRTGHAPATAADRIHVTEDVSRQPATRNAPTTRRA
jgi:anti-sigma regulatory factor (Ser/Thr protein kinase)